jgi:SanA protein
LDTAAYAYENGLIEQIIVSGDNRTEHYNEPIAMKNYLMKKGIKKSDIYVDYA